MRDYLSFWTNYGIVFDASLFGGKETYVDPEGTGSPEQQWELSPYDMMTNELLSRIGPYMMLKDTGVEIAAGPVDLNNVTEEDLNIPFIKPIVVTAKDVRDLFNLFIVKRNDPKDGHIVRLTDNLPSKEEIAEHFGLDLDHFRQSGSYHSEIYATATLTATPFPTVSSTALYGLTPTWTPTYTPEAGPSEAATPMPTDEEIRQAIVDDFFKERAQPRYTGNRSGRVNFKWIFTPGGGIALVAVGGLGLLAREYRMRKRILGVALKSGSAIGFDSERGYYFEGAFYNDYNGRWSSHTSLEDPAYLLSLSRQDRRRATSRLNMFKSGIPRRFFGKGYLGRARRMYFEKHGVRVADPSFLRG